jgi:RHS repeat-associated protein
MTAAFSPRLPLAIACGLIASICFLLTASAGLSAGETLPYLDPAYSGKLLEIVQDTSRWSDVEDNASGQVQGTLGQARLEAVRASLPTPSALGRLEILEDTANSWKLVVADTSQYGVVTYLITMGTGLGTVSPFTTGHGQIGHAYWSFSSDGKLRTTVCGGSCGYAEEYAVNGGNPIWAATFTGADDSNYGRKITASMLFESCSAWCKNLDMSVGSFVPPAIAGLLSLERGNLIGIEGYPWCVSGLGVYAKLGPIPGYGHECGPNDEALYGPIATPHWSARWMNESGIPKDPVAMSTPIVYGSEGSVSARRTGALTWDLDAARDVIGSDPDTTDWVNCQLLIGPTNDLSGCIPPLPDENHAGPPSPNTAPTRVSWADPIDTESGGFYKEESDAWLDGSGLPFELTRTYNSLDPLVGAFGKGWASSLTPSLTKGSSGVIQLRTETGQRINYTPGEDGSYSAASDVRSVLEKTDSGWSLKIKDQTVQSFDQEGRLVSWLDLNGVGLAYSYNGSGFLSSITDGAGRKVNVQSDSLGRIVKATLPDERAISYVYDGDQLVSFTDQSDAVTRYEYDSLGRMTRAIDANGDVSFQNTYDSEGRVVSQVNAVGSTTTLEWSNDSTEATDGAGHEWTYVYDDQGRLVNQTDPSGNAISYSFDASSNVSSFTDERQKTTEMTYDDRGNMLTRTTPDGAVESWTYDADDQVTSHTDQLGHKSSSEYDANGNLVKETDVQGRITTYTYDGNGQVLTEKDPLGRTTRNTYDADGDLVATISPSGAKKTMRYDDAGRLIAEVDPRGNEPGADPADYTTKYEYDADGRLTRTTDALGNSTSTEYDTIGQVVGETDTNGNVTQYRYDAAGNKTAEIAPDSATTLYEYDDSGKHVIKKTDPLGNVTRYGYDKVGRQTSVTLPSGAKTTYEYDDAGNRVSTTDPLDNETTVEYDVMDRPVESTDPLGGVTKTRYDYLGQTISVTDPLGNATRSEYDASGNLVKTTDPLGHEKVSNYNAASELVSETDENGHTAHFEYDQDGRQISVTAPGGATTRSSYDADGNLVTSTDENGNVTKYQYDAAGRKIGMTDPLGAHWTYAYDAEANLVSTEDPLASVTRSTYDSSDREIESIDALGEVSKTDYDLNGNVVSETDPLGNVTTSKYDSDGNLVETTDPLGHETTSTYDEAGRVVATTDPNGNTTHYVYDANGRKISEKSPDGSITRYEYDAVGNRIGATDANDHVTTSSYDAAGRKIGMTDPTGAHWVYTYDAVGNLLRTTDPLGNVTRKVYDSNDREIESVDGLGRVTKTAYDPAGNEISKTDPLGNKTLSEYDAAGRPVKTTDPLGQETTSTYDEAGQLVAETDANGHTTRYGYDAAGQKISTEAPDGSVTRFAYDAAGNGVSITDANGHTTTWTYDAASRKTEKVNALGSTWRYSYDAGSNLTETRTPTGGVITQSYDSQNRLVHKSYSDDTPSVSYAYDAVGNRESMTDATGATFYQYDPADRLTRSEGPSGSFSYVYDDVGNLLSRTYPNGDKTTYSYDAAGEMTTASMSSETTLYGYDENGRLISTLHPNGILDTRSYDDAGHLVEVEGVRSNGSAFYSRFYTLDAIGNPLEMAAERGPVKANGKGDTESWKETYRYDSNDRLLKACLDASCSSFQRYRYDPVGNRLRERTESGVTRYRYDAADELIRSKDPEGSVTHYRFDEAGNQIQEGDTHFTYDLENELTSIRENGTRISYAYTGEGLVASKLTPGDRISYSWDTNAPLAQLALETKPSSGSLLRSYTYGEGPISFTDRAGKEITYHADSIGSIVELSNANAKNVGSYRYSPYGEELDPNASETADARSNPTRYAGQYLDSDSGLYYMRAREYDPSSGRFLEQDPKEEELGEQDLSDYLYAEDDPTLLTDPSGLDPNIFGKTLKCKKNKLLCKLMYAVGYEDGCGYSQLRDSLTALAARGIYFEHILESAQHKGKLVNSNGSKGPGLYFLHYGGRSEPIEIPYGSRCDDWRCSLGFAETQILDCKSLGSCNVQGALFVLPIPTKGLKVLKRFPKIRKGLNLVIRGLKGRKAARTAKTVTELSKGVARTFAGGKYATKTLDKDIVLYRFYGGRSAKLGSFWTRTRYSSAARAKQYLALPVANDASKVAIIRVPTGTTIYEGKAAALSGRRGGGNQVFIKDVSPQWLR